MTLFIPDIKNKFPTETFIAKGQIYNLDTNEYFDFQFNPEQFIWEKSFNYSEITFKGDESGGHLQYLNSGPATFDLSLVFIADPNAPSISYSAKENIIPTDSFAKIDFNQLTLMLDRWQSIIVGVGRPSVLKIILGLNSFDGIIENLQFNQTGFFEDLSVREANIVLSFREWKQKS